MIPSFRVEGLSPSLTLKYSGTEPTKKETKNRLLCYRSKTYPFLLLHSSLVGNGKESLSIATRSVLYADVWWPCLKVLTYSYWGWEGVAVAQMVHARRYKPESCVRYPMGSYGFLLTYSSGRTMAQRSIQPLTEMSSKKIKAAVAYGWEPLTSSWADCLEILESSTSWNPSCLYRPAQGYLYMSCLWKYSSTPFKL